jgi:hypothetical protein
MARGRVLREGRMHLFIPHTFVENKLYAEVEITLRAEATDSKNTVSGFNDPRD